MNNSSNAAESKDNNEKKSKKRKTDNKKNDENDDEDDNEDNKESSPKKAKKTETFACEDNRGVGDAIREMGVIYFKNKDNMKGGVYSRAAKAIRECEIKLTNKKDALKIKGIGKGIAGYMEEFWETGMISKLEELRAGTA